MKYQIFLTFDRDKVISMRKYAYSVPFGQYGVMLSIDVPDEVFEKPRIATVEIDLPASAVVVAAPQTTVTFADPDSGGAA